LATEMQAKVILVMSAICLSSNFTGVNTIVKKSTQVRAA